MAASTTDTPLPHTMNPTTHTPIAGDTLTPTTIATPDTWDPAMCHALIDELWALRAQMVEAEARHANVLTQVSESYRTSARNFVHYLTLREEDRRHLQAQLASIGVSSLGRAETHVLANLDKVLGILHQLVGKPWADLSGQEPTGIHRGQTLLAHHAHALLGGTPPNRVVRIMLTLPSEAATDPQQVQQWVNAGMDIARINCAHDGPAEWAAMAAHVRQAAQQAGRPVKVLMDLGGPKLRTGLLPPGPAVLKVRPQRDTFGRVIQPALLGLRPTGSSGAVANATAHVGVKADWLAGLEVGDSIEFVDARDAHRTLKVVATRPQGALAELDQTAYFVPSTRLTRHRHGKHAPANSRLNDLPRQETRLTLQTATNCVWSAKPPLQKATTAPDPTACPCRKCPARCPRCLSRCAPANPSGSTTDASAV
jgi:pyruvate kinase